MPDKNSGERLQKVLANAGIASRRKAEDMIRDGRVKINAKVAQLGDKVSEGDKVFVDNKPVGHKRIKQNERYVIIYNKPEGEIVTNNDPGGRPTVFKNLPRVPDGRWISVGRLDINSAGLMLFTNDGELANRLMHPRYQIDREYAVRVNGEVTDQMVKQLVSGVELEDGKARFEDVVDSGGEGSNRWFHVVIMEGRKREVRRMWDAVGAQVSRLKRVRYGPIFLDSKVKVGRWRELDKEERKALLERVGMKADRPWGTVKSRETKHKVKGARPASPWKKRDYS